MNFAVFGVPGERVAVVVSGGSGVAMLREQYSPDGEVACTTVVFSGGGSALVPGALDEVMKRMADAVTPASGTAAAFVAKALEMVGKPYVFGAEADLKDKSPEAFDCSELVQWAAAQAGGMMPDGSAYQLRFCEGAGTRLSPEQAMLVRGGLLFRPGHVAISLGDGRTIEARGKAYGVGEFHAEGRGWTAGALVPGMRY